MVTDELRAYFSEKGIKQVEVADKLGVKKSFISELLAGKRTLGHETAVKLNKFYGFDLNWLLTGEGEMLRADSAAEEPATYAESAGEIAQLRAEVDELKKQLDDERRTLLEQNKRLTDIIDRLTKEG